MPEYVRVQDTTSHHKFSVIAGSDMTGLRELKQPAVDEHEQPLPPEFHDQAAKATTSKES